MSKEELLQKINEIPEVWAEDTVNGIYNLITQALREQLEEIEKKSFPLIIGQSGGSPVTSQLIHLSTIEQMKEKLRR